MGISRVCFDLNMALIHLFRRCNQKCVFCSYPADAKAGGGADLGSWLKEISGMKPGLVQISGGEPLLADLGDLIKVIAFCAKTGRIVELQTNGVLIPALAQVDLKLLVHAVGAAKGYFNVNFPAHSAALDLKITGTPGAFAARKKAIGKLLALGAKVRLTHVISSLNYDKTPEFAVFAVKNFNTCVGVVSKHGVQQTANTCVGAVSKHSVQQTAKGPIWLQFSFIKGLGRAEGSRLIPEYHKAAPYLLKALDLCGKKGLKCDVDHIPPCFLGPHHARNVDIEKMRAGVKGPHLVEKKKVPECRGCVFFRLCPGPRKDYIAAHPALFPLFGETSGVHGAQRGRDPDA